MSDEVSGLPEGWVETAISNIALIVTGNTPPTSKPEYYGGTIPFVKPPNLLNRPIEATEQGISSLGRVHARIVPAETVLVSCIGNLGKTGITTKESAFNQQINAAIFSPRVHPRYGFYACQLLRHFLEKVASATTISIVNKRKFSEAPLRIAPRAEQARIVSKIEELFSDLDAGISGLQRAKTNLKRYRAAVLKAAVEGKLTEKWRAENPPKETASELLKRILEGRRKKWEEEQRKKYAAAGKPLPKNWREKYKEPAEPDTSDLPPLPAGWCWATVEQLTPLDRPCAYGVLQPGAHVKGGIPLVRVGDINSGKVDQNNLKCISYSIASRYPRTKLQGGEVAITLVGAIGRTAVIPVELAGGNTARAVGIIPMVKGVNPNWVEIWFRNPAMVNEMTLAAHEVARKTLNLEDVRSAAVAFPPTSEQNQIFSEVEARASIMDTSENIIAINLKRTNGLRQSILKRAFEGKLVPQDPNDEPASVLLERIKAEKAAATPTQSENKKRKRRKKRSKP